MLNTLYSFYIQTESNNQVVNRSNTNKLSELDSEERKSTEMVTTKNGCDDDAKSRHDSEDKDSISSSLHSAMSTITTTSSLTKSSNCCDDDEQQKRKSVCKSPKSFLSSPSSSLDSIEKTKPIADNEKNKIDQQQQERRVLRVRSSKQQAVTTIRTEANGPKGDASSRTAMTGGIKRSIKDRTATAEEEDRGNSKRTRASKLAALTSISESSLSSSQLSKRQSTRSSKV